MTYHNAEKYIIEAREGADEKHYSHDRIAYVASLLGAPQKKLNYIHLAGSNGKTICSALLSSVLAKSGYNVCTITLSRQSDIKENIRHNATPISIAELTEMVQTVSAAVTKAKNNITCAKALWETEVELSDELLDIPESLLSDEANLTLTRAEIILLAGICFYAKNGCEICVLESTHGATDPSLFLKPPFAAAICGAIPNEDKKQIARIRTYIRRGITEIVSAPQNAFAHKTISDICAEINCRFTVPVRSSLTVKQLSLIGTSFVYGGEAYKLSLCGRFQTTNAITVIEIVKMLRRCGFDIPTEKEKEGLSSVKIKSRFEVLSASPTIIADSTYKLEAVETVCESFFDFSEITGRYVKLCLPCDAELINTYIDMLTARGYKIPTIYTISKDEVEKQSVSAGIPADYPLEFFKTPKQAAKALLSSLDRDDVLIVSGRYSFTDTVRLEIMRGLAF